MDLIILLSHDASPVNLAEGGPPSKRVPALDAAARMSGTPLLLEFTIIAYIV
jgi:hypothetical protein